MSSIQEQKKQQTRISGLNHVSRKLTKLGWQVASPVNGISTILQVTNKAKTASFEVQSRASQKADEVNVPLHKPLPEWWVITTHANEANPICYILSREDVIRLLAERGKKDKDGRVWLDKKSYTRAEFKETWDRLTTQGLREVGPSYMGFTSELGKNSDTYDFAFSEDAQIEMWSSRRLPYIDRQTLEEKDACLRLSSALKKMPCDEFRVISATYTSLCNGHFDIENVLAYNIGMAAFSQTGRRGMCFKRIWATPPSSPSGGHFDHHQAYRLVEPPAKPSGGVTLTVELPEPDNVARIWWEVSRAAADGSPNQRYRLISGQFALHVEIGLKGRKSLPSILKKLVDGIVSGLQADPEPNIEAANLLAGLLSCPSQDVVNHLSRPASPVLGNRARLVIPYRKKNPNSLKWNPDDERCESLTVISAGPPGRCVITITEMGC